MPKNPKLHKNTSTLQKLSAVIVITAVAIIGIHYLITSFAASSFVAVNADIGTVADGAQKASCTGASDGNCVEFGSSTTTTPPTGVVPDVPAGTVVPTTVLFNDNFTGTTLSSSWDDTDAIGANFDGESSVIPANTVVDNGLNLIVDDNGNGAEINTDPSNAPNGKGFTFSPTPEADGHPFFVEAKASFPGDNTNGVYNWPAIWTSGVDWPNDGEIDIAEIFGDVTSTAIWYSPGNANNAIGIHAAQAGPYGDYLGAGSYDGGMHTYGALIYSDSITFYYDGKFQGTLDQSVANSNGAGSPNLPFNLPGPMYLIANNAGNSNVAVDGTAGPGVIAGNQVMHVAYYRVWGD